jgi:hypothetical protein
MSRAKCNQISENGLSGRDTHLARGVIKAVAPERSIQILWYRELELRA